MRIVIDGAELDVFSGARVKDAVLKLSGTAYENLLNKKLRVLDRFGNRIDADGALRDGQQLHIFNDPTPEENHD